MPSKDNIKSFDSAKKKSATTKSAVKKTTTKRPSSTKASSAKTASDRSKQSGRAAQSAAKNTTKKKTASNIKAMPSYKETKHEINENHKIEQLREREEKRIIRKENKERKREEQAEKSTLRKQKRSERKIARRENYVDTVSDKVVNEVIGIIFIGLGIFMFMCLFGISTGVFGEMINACMHGLFGYFSYILPIIVIVGGVLCMVSASKTIKVIRLVFAIGAVALLASWLQIFPYESGKFDNDTFMIFLKSTYNKGLDSVGTGALFSAITFLGVQLFGFAGAKLLIGLFFVAFVLVVTNQSLSKITRRVIDKTKANYKANKEKERTLARSEIKAINNKPRQGERANVAQKRAGNINKVEYSEPPFTKRNEQNIADDVTYEEQSQVLYNSNNFNQGTSEQISDEYVSTEKAEQRKSNIIGFNDFVQKREQHAGISNESEHVDNEQYSESHPTIVEMPEFTGEKRKMNVTIDGEIIDDGSTESIAAPVDESQKSIPYIFPSLDLLEPPQANQTSPVDEEEVYAKARAIEQTLSDFGIGGKVNNITHGPVITRYEYSVPSGTKMSKVTSLDKELAYSLECSSIRIEAPIPNKAAIGIEVPNKKRSTVYMRELLESPEFVKKDSLLAFAVGKDIAGNIIIGDISKMPHTLISGATGSGKSVFVNCILLSILYKASPMDVKLIMVDPKKVEFEKYKGIPHLLFPVVSNPKRAAGVLQWCVKEMEDRYEKMAKMGVRDLRRYNQIMKNDPSDDPDLQPLPLIVIVIDELSDLMVVAGDDVEDSIYRLAQMARAAGMYLIIATQRPSVDVITGVIKANIPSRIALKVASPHDSRTIIDSVGAEQLLGNGDMIYKPQGLDRSLRVQGAWVSDDDVENVVDFIRNQNIEMQTVQQESLEDKITEIDKKFVEAGNMDELLPEAIAFVVKEGEASVSMLQRRFRIGHGRAGNLIDEMEKRGVVGPHLGSKPREVLISKDEYDLGFTPDEIR